MPDPSNEVPNFRQPLANIATADIEQSALKDEEASLISAIAQSRDRAAFTELFGRYAPKVKSFALHLGADSAAAEEVVQEVMIAVWRRAETFNSAKASVSTWIFTIARNKRYDHFRRAQRPIPDPNDPAFVPQGTLPQDEIIDVARLQKTVRSAVAALPAEQAELVRLSFFEGKAHRAIADELELPLGTVKSRVRLALSKLRKAMEGKNDA
jgi:RNA polymerase sigma-70 factor (ECF subfamily)